MTRAGRWMIAALLVATGCPGGDDDDASVENTPGDDDTTAGDDDTTAGDDDTTAGDDDTTAGDDDDTSPPPGSAVSATLGPAGGTLIHPDGATLSLPVGALEADTLITIRLLAEPDPRGFHWTGPVFGFEPAGLEFAVPASVTLDVDPLLLGSDPLAAVRVYHAPGSSSAFAPVVTSRDPAAGQVTGQLSSFSKAGPGKADADRALALEFSPRDLAFSSSGAASYLWVMGEGYSSTNLKGAYLYRVDGSSGQVDKWVGESEVFPDMMGPTWFDGWGVWVDAAGSQAWFVGQPFSDVGWTVNTVSLAGRPDLSRSYFVEYKAPSSGGATFLQGVARNNLGTWATFQQGCGQFYQQLAPTTADPTSTGPCPSRPPVLVGNQTVKLNDCNYKTDFTTYWGQACAKFMDFAPSSTGPNDVVATDSHQRLVYMAHNADFEYSTVVGVAGYYDTAGFRDGPAFDADMQVRALFNNPRGLVVASDGTIYVADTGNDAVRRIEPAGTLAWSTVVTVYGGPESGELEAPESVTLEPDESALWVADSGNRRLVRLLLP